MAKILFLLNENLPDREKYYCKDPITVSNFVYPNSMVLKDIGIEQYMGISRKYATSIECVNAPIKFLDIPIYRNIFDVKNILIAYKRVNKYIKDLKIDYIHCNTPIGGFLGRVCGKRCKVKRIIYTAHGFHFYKGAPLLNWLVFYPIERFLARWTDVLLTINEEDYIRAKGFSLRGEGKVFKIPGVGIDISQINEIPSNKTKLINELGLDENSIIITSVGELNRNKNNIVVLKTLAKLNNARIHYVICGVGPKKAHLLSMAREIGVEESVHFMGFRTDVIEILKSSDIYILPSIREGLPRSLMEAMACGLPCIVSRIRGNVDLIHHGEGGFLVEPNDIEGFALSIGMILQKLSSNTMFNEFNRERVVEFSNDTVKSKLFEIYHKSL
jgi:glycosyltransferase involved in cell wall biosynthesis